MTSESRTITRKSASNLALAFVLLPKAKRDAMSVFYAFCREVDDVADEESTPVAERRAQLEEWRADVRRAAAGGAPVMAVNRELKPVIAQYRLSLAHFEELIRGVEMDLDVARYQTYGELEEYCYRVASVVGLLSIEIFGYRNPSCRDYAIHLGKALQLTNILRDVRVDAERGRIYLPLAELERHGVRPEEILGGQYSERYERLAGSVAGEARKYFARARQALPAEDRRAMVAAELMGSVYWRLLRQLERERFNVFGPALVRVSRGRKVRLVFGAWLRLVCGMTAGNYGAAG